MVFPIPRNIVRVAGMCEPNRVLLVHEVCAVCVLVGFVMIEYDVLKSSTLLVLVQHTSS